MANHRILFWQIKCAKLTISQEHAAAAQARRNLLRDLQAMGLYVPSWHWFWQKWEISGYRRLKGIDFREFCQSGAPLRDKIRVFCLAIVELLPLEKRSPVILHGDLSPKNLIVTPPFCRWIDWDCASEESLCEGACLGFFAKPAYLSPEKAWTGRSTLKSEIFALGAMLYEIVTGDALFAHDWNGLQEAKNFNKNNWEKKLLSVPIHFRAIVANAIHFDPHLRTPHMRDLLQQVSHATRKMA